MRSFVVIVVAVLAAVAGSFQCPLDLRTIPSVMTRRAAASDVEQGVEKGIAMLEQKGVFESRPRTRQEEFDALRNPETDEDLNKRNRLLRLVRTEHDVELDGSAPSELHRWDRNEFPGYDDVTLLEDPRTLVQRHQRSGFCYFHAPVVVQYYAIWFHKLEEDANANSDHQMIDMTAYIVDKVDGKAMENYIFRDLGGSSQRALEDILQPGSIVSDGMKELAPELLTKYGPALVSNFKVYTDFANQALHKHYGQPVGAFEGCNAMALVGSRRDENSNVFFLLQNWWLKKQFIEVDLEYLKACGATLYFVETPQASVPMEFPTHAGHIMQTEAIDMQERYALEGPLKHEPAWMIAERAAAMARLGLPAR